MIDYCVSIPDRELRTECAYTIAHLMERFYPELGASTDGERKIWDHMNIMSGFALDIDFPVAVTPPDQIHPQPAQIHSEGSKIRFRHYGRIIQEMIERVAEMEEGEEKEALISMIAHHMKKLMLVHNKEGVDDARILRDLAEYSKGRIVLDPNTYVLHEFAEIPVETNKKKRNK